LMNHGMLAGEHSGASHGPYTIIGRAGGVPENFC
jgi:hypothetical protein